MSARAKQDQRRNVKKAIDKDDSRRKREEQANGLRKNKREESLQKRRNLAGSTDALEETSAPTLSSQTTNDRYKLADLVAGLTCDDPLYILDCATRIRKLLSVKTNPPIDSVVQAGAVPRLINLLGLVSQPQIQFESCWALTNVASGSLEQTMAVVNANAVPMFVRLLEVPSPEVREQALWALANIAGENPDLRDLVISHGAIELVIAQFTANPAPSISMIRNATWAISNFSRGLPAPPKEVAIRLLPVITHLIKHNDEAVVSDASWACSYLSEDGAPAAITRIIECPGLLPALINNLLHPSATVVTPSLRTLGNVVTGDEAQTQIAIDSGLCTALSQQLSSKKRTIRKEACWALSNVTAGNARQIQAVLDAPGCIQQLVELFTNDEQDVRKECCWLFANITCGGTTKQIRDVVRAGLIEPFCQHLQKAAKNDTKIAVLIMQSLNNILKIGEKENKSKCELRGGYSNPYAESIEEFGGLDTIESLQTHSDPQVYQLAVHLIEGYFLQDDEEEIENTTPNTANNAATAATKSGFSFGIPPGGFPGAANMTFSF